MINHHSISNRIACHGVMTILANSSPTLCSMSAKAISLSRDMATSLELQGYTGEAAILCEIVGAPRNILIPVTRVNG